MFRRASRIRSSSGRRTGAAVSNDTACRVEYLDGFYSQFCPRVRDSLRSPVDPILMKLLTENGQPRGTNESTSTSALLAGFNSTGADLSNCVASGECRETKGLNNQAAQRRRRCKVQFVSGIPNRMCTHCSDNRPEILCTPAVRIA